MPATKSLRVLFLSPHYPPDVAATGQLVCELAEDLVRMGHQAEVLAARPSRYVSGSRPYRLLETEHRNGVKIHWLGVSAAGRYGLWSRLLPFIGYFIAAAIRGLAVRRVDIVFAQSTPPLLAGLLGRFLSLLPGRHFVYNLQDVYPDLGQALGVLRPGLLLSLTHAIERYLRRKADMVVVLSEDMAQRSGIARDNTNFAIGPNWADTDALFPIDDDDNKFVEHNDLDKYFVVMYSGNLGRAHGLDVLPEMAARLAHVEDILVLIVGDGAARDDLMTHCSSQGLKNVRFMPFQELKDLRYSLSAADIGLILQRNGAAGLLVPSKVYGILACGRAVVAAVPSGSEVEKIVTDNEVGRVVSPADPGALAGAILALYDDRDELDAMGQRAREAAVKKFSRRMAARRYLELFNGLVQNA